MENSYNPLISVIIPVYNVEKYLHECVDSVINQTYENIEVLLIDDGSTDKSPIICDEYAAKDKRIKVIHKENGGVSSARNKGIDISNGEYIIFLDSDDYWTTKELLEKLVVESNDSDVIMFNVYEQYSDLLLNEKIKKYYNSILDTIKDILNNNPDFSFYSIRYLIRKKIITENGIYYPLNTYYEDTATIYRLFIKPYRFSYVNICGYFYRYNKKGITSSKNIKIHIDHLNVIDNNIKVVSKLCISSSIKKMLLNNFALGYISLVYVLSHLEGEKYKELLKEMENHLYIIDYIKIGKQRLVKYLIKLIGITKTTKLLTFRRKIKYGK